MEEGSSWIEVYPLKSGRSGHRMVELDGVIYAMGGWDNEGAHWSNEKFTPNSWGYIADTYNRRKIAVMCLADDGDTKEIYQIGGYEPG